MKRHDLREAFQEFEKLSQQLKKEVSIRRDDAVGLLTPELLERYASGDQDLVLAYGRNGKTVSYSPEELRAFLEARKSKGKRFKSSIQGVPYTSLIRASLPVDKQRAKEVRSATFYQRKGGLLFFQVSGNTQRYYRVQIRLEGWTEAVMATTPSFQAAKALVSGRLSFECPCGRHQYWYRYLATLGGYAIEPLERDFPKIRNPRLTGCCCKHVLRVLQELKKNRVLMVLARELEKERGRPGFKSAVRKSTLSNANLRAVMDRKTLKEARAALEEHRKESEKLKRELKPRGSGKKTLVENKALVAAVETILKAAKAANLSPDAMLGGVAKNFGVTREQIDAIIKERKL